MSVSTLFTTLRHKIWGSNHPIHNLDLENEIFGPLSSNIFHNVCLELAGKSLDCEVLKLLENQIGHISYLKLRKYDKAYD